MPDQHTSAGVQTLFGYPLPDKNVLQPDLLAHIIAQAHQSDLILQHITDAVLLADNNGVIQFVNPAWERLTGYSNAEVLGEYPTFLRSEKSDPGIYVEIMTTIAQGQVWAGVVPVRRKDGTVYPAHSTIVPVRNQQGKIHKYVELHRDVTREHQLAQMKEEFIANAAHDLANPITVLQTSLFLLKRDPAQLSRRMEVIEKQVNRLSQLIKDLMTLSRLDRHVVQPVGTPVDLNALVFAIVTAEEALADEHGVTIHFENDTSVPLCRVDADHMERILINLLSNALQYTPRGGSVDIRLYIEGDFVVLTLKDTGIGIPQNDLPHIFDRFFRSDNARLVSDGTGLGLAIVKELVEINNGHLTVESVLKQGTTFHVFLPVAPLKSA